MNEILSHLTDVVIYAAIAVVTLIGVVRCLLPLMGSTAALRRAIRRLQQDAGNRQGTPVWQEKRFMGNRLKGSWLRFLQNAEQLDRRGLPCNVEDYINDDTVTHGPGNAPLAELVPSLLTSLGILGTFMGMMSGLSGLDFTNADKIIDGIPVLLDGMKTAFGTSVAGVSCSIIFNMLNRILQGSSYRAIDDFVECFTTLAMQRPLDNDVQLICQNQDSNHMLSGLSETLPVALSGAMEVSVTRAMQPVAQAMDSFLVGATRAQVEGVNRIVNNFVQQMNASLSDQFVQLGRTMTEINQNQQLSLEQLRDAMQASRSIVASVTELHGVSHDVMTHFEQYVRELGDARRRDERFEQTAAQLLTQLQQMSETQSSTLMKIRTAQETLSRSMEQFTVESTRAVSSMQRAGDAHTQQLDHVAETMVSAGKELSDSCENFVSSVVGGLSQSLGMFDQSMTALINTLSEKLDHLSSTDGDTAAQTADMQRLLTDVKQLLADKEG